MVGKYVELPRKVCDVTIGRTESPVLFRAIRRSREKAAVKQEKVLPLFRRQNGHFCPQCGQFRGGHAGAFPQDRWNENRFIHP